MVRIPTRIEKRQTAWTIKSAPASVKKDEEFKIRVSAYLPDAAWTHQKPQIQISPKTREVHIEIKTLRQPGMAAQVIQQVEEVVTLKLPMGGKWKIFVNGAEKGEISVDEG